MITDVLVLSDYTSTRGEELTVRAGDKVDIFHNTTAGGEGWCLVSNETGKDGKQYGWVPGGHLCPFEGKGPEKKEEKKDKEWWEESGDDEEDEEEEGEEEEEKEWWAEPSDDENDDDDNDDNDDELNTFGGYSYTAYDYGYNVNQEFADFCADPFGGLTFSSHGQRNVNAPMSAQMFGIRMQNQVNHNALGGWRYDETTGQRVYDEGYI